MKRVLVTTALEETWGDGHPLIFLGEWCRRFSRHHVWRGLDAKVLPYHWDDRTRLSEDYSSLTAIYETLLADLAYELNSRHAVTRSIRYWRILIGPWLGYFLHMLFDRWLSIQQALACEISHTVVLETSTDEFIPSDMADFERLMVTDRWNHQIYASMMPESISKIFYRPILERDQMRAQAPMAAAHAKSAALRLYRGLAGSLRRETDVVLHATYLPEFESVKLQMSLGQFPQRWWAAEMPRVSPDSKARNWSIPGLSHTRFEAIARELMPQHIPTAYLEGYSELVGSANRLPWPNRPQAIMTGNPFTGDVFKAWTAAKVEQGSALVVGQNGGTYGSCAWLFCEDHQIEISDRFLTWGWSKEKDARVIPVGQLKAKRLLRARTLTESKLALVTVAMPRYSHHLGSTILSRQWLDYFDDQCDFVASLPSRLRDVLAVRLYPEDYGWDQAERWRERFPEIHLDDINRSMDALIRESRVFVSSYNSTTFLESISMNVPTVFFWDPSHWELRSSAAPYFEDLRSAAVFHTSPKSAASHIEAVWENPDHWWRSERTRTAIARFRHRFCRKRDDLAGAVRAALRGAHE